jgi:hypothetical protein
MYWTLDTGADLERMIIRIEKNDDMYESYRQSKMERTSHLLDSPCLRGKEHRGECLVRGAYMPTYSYRSDDGQVLERHFPIESEIPTEIEEDGVTYKRKYVFGGFTIK